MDLNIVTQRDSERVSNVERTLHLAFEFGYTTVALNTIIGTNCFTKEGVQIPKFPTQVETENGDSSRQVLSRLTAMVENEMQCRQLTLSSAVKQYDILAVEPMNEKVFANICASMEFDIMVIDLCNLHFPLKREQLKIAKGRGIHFEIQYSQLFDADRTWTIANGRNLVSASCKKNIILSSGATKYMQIREPSCVMNLCSLFGLNRRESKDAVINNGLVVLKQARMRTKTGKAVISFQDNDKLSPKEIWLIEACTLPASAEDTFTCTDIMAEELKEEESYEIPPKRVKTN